MIILCIKKKKENYIRALEENNIIFSKTYYFHKQIF